MLPIPFKRTICKILFTHFLVESIVFVPSMALSLFPLELSSGLVIDSGFSDTRILPIFEGAVILKCAQFINIGEKHVFERILDVLRTYPSISKNADRVITKYMELRLSLKEVIQNVEELPEEVDLSELVHLEEDEHFDESTLQDIKVKFCYVKGFETIPNYENINVDEYTFDTTENIEYKLPSNRILHINENVRKYPYDIMFGWLDEEESLCVKILECLRKCPIDTRKILANNIVITGGNTMVPGFKQRIIAELKHYIQLPDYQDLIGLQGFFNIKPSPFPENILSWVGGSIIASLDFEDACINRESYIENPYIPIPDWVDSFVQLY
eukprot:TRINITY_DN11562_c0_g1_i2.p1 TRINITY_DN11562_c0_g1~~TRINITY_DN11562_c0_g1_i2.p1  ORF type:complete len:327 (-),score=78.37 TRINITY_DN11562_c0_g1_i2:93-1073(-)